MSKVKNSIYIYVIHTNSDDIISLNAQHDASLNTPPAEEESVVEQALNNFCKATSLQIRHLNNDFHLTDRQFLVCMSIVDDVIRVFDPESLRNRIHYISHYPPLVGHRGQREMYFTLQRSYWWPRMANDVYTAVAKCKSRVRNGNRHLHKRRTNSP